MNMKKNLESIIEAGETLTVEFKSWIKARNMKERINLAVDELIAFANTNGGTVYFGIEDDGTVTGCTNYDCQKILEAIYDKTRPSLFCDINELSYEGHVILAISVNSNGTVYATTDGRCLKRLGKNSKPYFPDEIRDNYLTLQNPDFSGQLLPESSKNDIDLLSVYKLKEKLTIRDPQSTLKDMENMALLRDLGLLRNDNGIDRLTVAGLLFIGKETSIRRLLPQAEVIYLHYDKSNFEEYDSRIDMVQPIISVLDRLTEKIQNENRIINIQVGLFRMEVQDFPEKVFQEALLNALSHRDYQNTGSIYVKHYPDKIVIESPGGFVDGITEKNIITHPSIPRNKLIAETLQRLKYVQRTGQGVDIIFKEMLSMGKPFPEYTVFDDAVLLTLESAIDNIEFVKFIVNEQEESQKILSLSELMILRYLVDNKRIKLSEVKNLTQVSLSEAKKNCMKLVKNGLVEIVGKEYMLTARVYHEMKSDIVYTQDQTVTYIKAKSRIIEYLAKNYFITNEEIRDLCGFTKQQARHTTDKMRAEGIISLVGKGRGAKYKLQNNL